MDICSLRLQQKPSNTAIIEWAAGDCQVTCRYPEQPSSSVRALLAEPWDFYQMLLSKIIYFFNPPNPKKPGVDSGIHRGWSKYCLLGTLCFCKQQAEG